jgi:hypothetical protein
MRQTKITAKILKRLRLPLQSCCVPRDQAPIEQSKSRRQTRSRPTTSSKRSLSPLRKDLKVKNDQYLHYWGYCALTRRVERREEGSLSLMSQKSDTCQMAGLQKNRMKS